MPESKSLVLLDFDGTLMKGDIFAAYLKFRLKEPKVLLRLPLAIPFFLLFKLGLLDNERAKQGLFRSLFAGERVFDFRSRAEDFWLERGLGLNPLIEEHIQTHRKNQAEFWIVSANFEPIIASFCKRAGAYSYLCTQLEEREGKLSGKFAGPNCYGHEKVNRLEQHFPDRNQFAKVYAYGDSAGDIPMLRWADEAYLLKNGHWQKV